MYRAPIILLCVLTMLLAACAAPAPAEPTPAGPGGAGGPTRVGFGALEFERAAYEPIIEAFNAANPDTRVEFVPLESLMMGGGDPAERARQLAESADTFPSLLAGPGEDAGGYLADLRPLMEADPSFDQADFQPGALPPGPLYHLPETLSVQTVSYNRDLWEAAGLAAPSPGWSWGDLLAAAEQLTRHEGDQTTVYGLDDGQGGLVVLLGLLAEAGVPLAPAADGRLDLDRPEVAAALGRVADLLERGVLYRQPEQSAPTSIDELGAHIRQGRVALWVGGAFAFAGPGGPGQPDFAVADAPLPALPRDSVLRSRGYAMSVGTASPAAAWRWLSYLSRQRVTMPAGLMIFGLGYDMPARRSLAESSGFWGGLPAERAAALEATLARAAGLPPAADELVRGNLSAALSAVSAGRPADQALAEHLANLSQQLAERAAAPAATPEPVQVRLPEPAAAPAGATSIRFGAFGPDAEAMRQLADAFNAQGSGVYVELEPPAFDGTDISPTAMAERLDCFAWPVAPAAAERAALRDLQPLIDADPSFDQGDYPAGLLAPLRADGGLYGLPYAVNLRALNYNRDAFAAAGLEAPRADWGLADLLDAAGRLTDKGAADPRYGYAVDGGHTDDLLAFLAWQGAAPVVGSGAERAPRFTDDQVVQALRAYLELLRDYSPHTELRGYKGSGFLAGEASSLAQAGRLGLWYSGGLDSVLIQIGGESGPRPDLAIAPPPMGEGGATSASVSASALLISASSQQPQACWEWLKFLSAQPGGLGERFPARTSVATSEAFLQQARPGAAEVYAAYAPALGSPPAAADPYAGLDLYWLMRAADRALQGGDLERELADAQARTEQYLACVAAGDEPRSCATSVDPEYEGVGPR